jgi:hypothetical protein
MIGGTMICGEKPALFGALAYDCLAQRKVISRIGVYE